MLSSPKGINPGEHWPLEFLNAQQSGASEQYFKVLIAHPSEVPVALQDLARVWEDYWLEQTNPLEHAIAFYSLSKAEWNPAMLPLKSLCTLTGGHIPKHQRAWDTFVPSVPFASHCGTVEPSKNILEYFVLKVSCCYLAAWKNLCH